MPLDLADPPNDPVQQLERQARFVAQERDERVPEQSQHAHRGFGDHAGASRTAVDRRELSEEVPGKDGAHLLAAARDLPAPRQHHEEGLAELSLLDDGLPLVEGQFVGLGGKTLQVLLREAREQRHGPEGLRVLPHRPADALLRLVRVETTSGPTKHHVGSALAHGRQPTPTARGAQHAAGLG